MMQAATSHSTFDEALDLVAALSLEDQVSLIETVRRRLNEQRRAEIARESEEALQEILAGGGSSGTAEDFKREFIAEL
jgi:hypothetical protein